MIFIPAYFWHWVFSTEESHGVNLFFQDSPENTAKGCESVYVEGSSVQEVSEGDIRNTFLRCRAEGTPLIIRNKASHWGLINVPVRTILQESIVNPQSQQPQPQQRYVVSQGGHSLCPLEKPNPAYPDTGISYMALPQQILLHMHPTLLDMVRIPPFLSPK
eukprot:PhF_6_TR37712/c0_g1_i1/m.56139